MTPWPRLLFLKRDQASTTERVGVWGISQAGWVIPQRRRLAHADALRVCDHRRRWRCRAVGSRAARALLLRLSRANVEATKGALLSHSQDNTLRT